MAIPNFKDRGTCISAGVQRRENQNIVKSPNDQHNHLMALSSNSPLYQGLISRMESTKFDHMIYLKIGKMFLV